MCINCISMAFAFNCPVGPKIKIVNVSFLLRHREMFFVTIIILLLINHQLPFYTVHYSVRIDNDFWFMDYKFE